MRTALPGIVAFVAAAAATSSAGCGASLYAVRVNEAGSKVAQAKQVGAETLAPYEYYYASEHLTKAMSEAAEGDYSDAIEFASEAEQYADKAIQLSREAHVGAAR
jgi:hypothetical protein